jgi:probable phosphoglycerate mutase
VTAVVFLVRHAAHALQDRTLVGRMPGVPLGPDAPAQIERLVRRLSRERIDAVVASPLERAQLTAQAVADSHGLKVETDEDLAEIDFGGWTGRSVDELENDSGWRVWCTRKSQARPPGGETIAEIQARVARALERVRRDRDGQSVALVSHGDPIKALVAFTLGFALDRLEAFDVDPASVSTLVTGDWGSKLVLLNERPA